MNYQKMTHAIAQIYNVNERVVGLAARVLLAVDTLEEAMEADSLTQKHDAKRAEE